MNARRMTVGMGMMAALLLAAGSAQADIIGVTGTGFATISFNDTNSLTPTLIAGTTNATVNQPNWTGANLTMLPTTDSITLDQAKGSLSATYTSGTPAYSVSLNSVRLIQAALNTGRANLDLSFSVQYQLDAGGLPSQATLFPNFTVDGTVQNSGVGFASMNGFINYYGIDSSGMTYLLDTVNYNGLWNTPGPFNSTVSGIAIFGTTPALGPNSTLTLDGYFSFVVDPATINLETIPEPATLSLLALGGLALLRRHRRT